METSKALSCDIPVSKLTHLYIISYKRPQCDTARALTRIKYPGEWSIVIGSDEPHLDEYKEKWGKHVIVFPIDYWVKRTEMLDNLDYLPHGASPARNFIAHYSHMHGEVRHWQFDDDYPGFRTLDLKAFINREIESGEHLYRLLTALAIFGYKAHCSNVGFTPAGNIGVAPENAFEISRTVVNAHNLPSEGPLWIPWFGRMGDDIAHGQRLGMFGLWQISFKWLQMEMATTQQNSGGLTSMYKTNGTVFKTAYDIETSPSTGKLRIHFGRYHHAVKWEHVFPKIISDKYDKTQRIHTL